MINVLNDKQKRILKLSANGLINEAIASELNISINTVKYHKKTIYRVLNISHDYAYAFNCEKELLAGANIGDGVLGWNMTIIHKGGWL